MHKNGGIKNIKIKDRKNINILCDIHCVMVNKYWSDVEEDSVVDIFVGFEIFGDDDMLIATVVKYIDEDRKALLEIPTPINYFELIKLGINMDRIVFDMEQRFIGITDINTKLNPPITYN